MVSVAILRRRRLCRDYLNSANCSGLTDCFYGVILRLDNDERKRGAPLGTSIFHLG